LSLFDALLCCPFLFCLTRGTEIATLLSDVSMLVKHIRNDLQRIFDVRKIAKNTDSLFNRHYVVVLHINPSLSKCVVKIYVVPFCKGKAGCINELFARVMLQFNRVCFVTVCWQTATANGHCFMDAKVATSATSFQSCRYTQPSIYSSTRPSSMVDNMKPGVLPLPQAVCSTSPVISVTTASVKTPLPTLVIRPLFSTVTTSTAATTSWPTGQLFLLLKV